MRSGAAGRKSLGSGLRCWSGFNLISDSACGELDADHWISVIEKVAID
jgi:hypothetical protein